MSMLGWTYFDNYDRCAVCGVRHFLFLALLSAEVFHPCTTPKIPGLKKKFADSLKLSEGKYAFRWRLYRGI